MENVSPVVSSTMSKSPSTPGSKRSKTIAEFKKPFDPPDKKKRKILEEDKFVEKLEKIIQRDFFPDLEKLKAQNAYHNAVENNDIHMLRELYSKYSMGATPRVLEKSNRATPSSFETPTPSGLQMGGGAGQETPTHLPMAPRPGEIEMDVEKSKKPTDSIASMSLNTFLANYTSEDNQSFSEILDNSDKKHKIKYSWLYEKEEEHQSKFSTSLVLPSIESQANYEKPLAIDTWTYKNLNHLMYVPDAKPLTPEEQVQLARKVPKVFYQNTRFEAAPFKDDSVNKTTGGSTTTTLFKKPTTKIGVDGKEIETETTKVNGFSFVRTPSPTPGVEESPFLTWGEIEGTPFRLDGSDTPVPVNNAKPYRILETTKREKIAMQLQEKVSERYRDRKLKAIETAKHNLASPTPRPRSSLDRLSTMSPAALRLVGSHLSNSSRDRSLAASYTPKPSPKLVTPSIRSNAGVRVSNTPTPTHPETAPKEPLSHAQKKKASDFF